MADATSIGKNTRERKTTRWFTSPDGRKAPRAHLEADGFGIEFVGTGEVLEAKLADFKPEVVNAAALFGFVTSITNAAGGADKSLEDAVYAASERLDALLKGDWSAERETGMRTADIIEAARRINDARGVKTDVEDLRQRLTSGQLDPKDLLSNARFAATIAAIQAEKKQAKAAELAAKVGKGDDADLDSLLSA